MAKIKTVPDPNIGRNIEAFMSYSKDLRSQPQLAARAGLAQSTVGRIIRGEVSPSAENLRKIAGALGVDVGAFFLPHDKLIDLGDARARLLEGRFEQTELPRVRIVGRLRDCRNGHVELEERDQGSLVGVYVQDGYALQFSGLGSYMGFYELDCQFLVLERKGVPAHMDLALVKRKGGGLHLFCYRGQDDETLYFESPGQTRYVDFTTVPRADLEYVHGVVALTSTRQHRP